LLSHVSRSIAPETWAPTTESRAVGRNQRINVFSE
jgi:hypothetical protein